MKLFTATLISLLLASAFAAPQFEALTGLLNSAIGSLIPAPAAGTPTTAKPTVVAEKQPNFLGCNQFIAGLKEGKFDLDHAGGSYSICFQSIPGTCGIKFDLSHLMTSADEPRLFIPAAPGTFEEQKPAVQETLHVPETPVFEKHEPVPLIPVGAPVQTPLAPVPEQFAPKETALLPEEPELVSKPKVDMCENSLFFPPTLSSFGGKVICLDRVTEPSVLLVGTPHVVYATTKKGLELTIPFAYLTSC